MFFFLVEYGVVMLGPYANQYVMIVVCDRISDSRIMLRRV